jgi:glycosyltransferase involved in cell wall biosynthesis
LNAEIRVSVVIPTIPGREIFLSHAISSVLAQTLTPVEILVIGDTKLEFDSNVNLKRIIVGRRLNAAQARNQGFKLASGEVIAFLDDDDFWDKNYLDESIQFLLERNLDAVFGQIWLFENDDVTNSIRIKSKESLNGIYHLNPGVIGSNTVVRKLCLDKVKGFREDLTVSQDKALAIDLAAEGFSLGFSPGKCFLRKHPLPRLTDDRSQLIGTIQFTKLYWKQMSFTSKVMNLQKVNSLRYRINPQIHRLLLKILFKQVIIFLKFLSFFRGKLEGYDAEDI